MIPTRRRLAVAVVSCVLLAGCGGDAQRRNVTPVLHWYAAPDRADLDELAETCTQESGGKYQIDVVELPANVDERRATLLRRLLAHDDAADIITVDTGLVAELGAAGVLAPVPPHRKDELAKNVFPHSLEASTYDGELVTVPWWHDPYLLWYRGLTAERAGLDPKKPIVWTDLINAAARIEAPILFEDASGAGLSDWVNALVVGAGGVVVDGTGRSPRIGTNSPAGKRAAAIVSAFAKRNPGPSADALTTFVEQDAAFLLAPSSAVVDAQLAPAALDLSFAPFPVVDAAKPVGPPLVGMTLGVPLYAPKPDFSYDAIDCLTSSTLQKTLMTSSAHSAARSSVYSDSSIREGYPLANVVRPSVEKGVIEPRTPYWHHVREALNATWGGSAKRAPQDSATLIAELLRGGLG